MREEVPDCTQTEIYIKFLKWNDPLDATTLLNGDISLSITKNRF